MTREHRSRPRSATPVLVGALAVAGCGPGASAGSAETAPPSAASSPSPPSAGATDQTGVGVARAFTDALNDGDSAAARALFAADARFDSVGRIYPDRDAIFDRFIDPEVIAVQGRYTERSTRLDGDRFVVEYDFTTGSGGREHFTYAYRIEDGLITDVVGRYV
jgi:SnoaL-like domain